MNEKGRGIVPGDVSHRRCLVCALVEIEPFPADEDPCGIMSETASRFSEAIEVRRAIGASMTAATLEEMPALIGRIG